MAATGWIAQTPELVGVFGTRVRRRDGTSETAFYTGRALAPKGKAAMDFLAFEVRGGADGRERYWVSPTLEEIEVACV